MFYRKKSWYRRVGKAFIFAGIIYKIADSFLKSSEKKAGISRKKGKKKDAVSDIRRLLRALRR